MFSDIINDGIINEMHNLEILSSKNYKYKKIFNDGK